MITASMSKRILWMAGLFGGLAISPVLRAQEPARPAADSSAIAYETRIFTIRSASLSSLLSKKDDRREEREERKDAKKIFEDFGIVFPAGTGISYREDSGLLIATHSSETLDRIEEIVLRLDPSAQRASSGQNREMDLKLDAIKIKGVEFTDTPIKQAIAWLVEESRNADPEKKGVNILLKPSGIDLDKITVNLNLRNVSVGQAIKYLTQVSGLKYRVEAAAVLIYAKE
jgi:hypothetical protein